MTELKQRLGTQLEGSPDNIRYLEQVAAGLASADPSTIWPDRVGFGSTVVLRNMETKEEVTYTLVTGDLIDLDAGQVSLASPVGQGLLGAARGDVVSIGTPSRKLKFKVISLTTLPQALGL
ncbi:MAG TPA: GreA/GreB family elongation factor [Longimicrobiaceae bacterium]|nr:GreA/GreB family elongation factor [Longimicrobiaceae bacterium]